MQEGDRIMSEPKSIVQAGNQQQSIADRIVNNPRSYYNGTTYGDMVAGMVDDGISFEDIVEETGLDSEDVSEIIEQEFGRSFLWRFNR